MLNWLLGLLAGGGVGFACGAHWHQKQTFPDEWSCPEPDCNYTAGSNDLGLLHRVIEQHEEYHRAYD